MEQEITLDIRDCLKCGMKKNIREKNSKKVRH